MARAVKKISAKLRVFPAGVPGLIENARIKALKEGRHLTFFKITA